MEINTTEELYEYLELNTVAGFNRIELTGNFKQLSEKTSDEVLKERLKWESLLFDFQLSSGEVKPIYSTSKEDGTTIYGYPSYDLFDDRGYAYLKERAKSSKSDYLIARYNQILWNAPKPHKHQLHAKNAIDAYIKILQRLNFPVEEKTAYEYLQHLRNGLSLSSQIKYKFDVYVSIMRKWLFSEGKSSKNFKLSLLRYMVEVPQLSKQHFQGTLELTRSLGTVRRKEESDYYFSKEIFETGLSLAQRLNSNPKIWFKRIGGATVKMAESRMNDNSKMIPLEFYKQAIIWYKKAGERKKVKETEQKYFELKKGLKLAKFEFPISDEHREALFNYLKKKSNKLLENEQQKIFGYLLSGHDIFPNKKWLDDMAKRKEKSFIDFVTTLRFDMNNNLSTQKKELSEIQKAKLYENYHLYMHISVMPYLDMIFFEGIKKNKVTFDGLINFFVEQTWLGQELVDINSGGDEIKYKWISLIAPSLYEYFVQTESAFKTSNPFTNYILAIDSLTLKFEGVLRDFAKLLNISTTTSGRENILREKYIEELLAEQEIKKYFDENDLIFFNYLFCARNGMNLRNNIAHSFFRYQHYSYRYMHLLICAFLRIGKYKIREQSG